MDLPLFFGFSMLFSTLLCTPEKQNRNILRMPMMKKSTAIVYCPYHCFHCFFLMKNYDKFLSTFPCNLEKKCVKNLYFHAFTPSLFIGRIVTCGFWGCHLWSLTLSFAAFEPLICHKWEPQSIALTTPKHSFYELKRCKENGSSWQSTTSENVDFWPFSHQNLFYFKKRPFFWGWNSEFILQFAAHAWSF